MRKRYALPLAATGLAGIAGGVAWIYRTPIVTHFVERELDSRGITATYRIEEIGFGRQRLTDIVIGDPKNPDLTAETVDLAIVVGVTGPSLAAIRAGGVRLRGRWDGERLQLGSLDSLIPESDGSPPALPDLVVALDRSSARIETPWGPVGIGVSGRGNLADGFRGAAAFTAPRLELAGCALEQSGGHLRLSSDGGRLVVRGPVDIGRAGCPDRQLTASSLQLGINGRSGDTLDSWTLRSGLRTASVTADFGSAARLSGEVDTHIRDGAVRLGWSTAASGVSAAGVEMGQLVLAGEGQRGRDGALSADGSVRAINGRLGRENLAVLESLAALDNSLPWNPIVRALTTSMVQAGRNWRGDADWQLRSVPGGTLSFSVGRASLSAGSGARIALAPGSIFSWDSGKGPAFGGTLAAGGGGIPATSLALNLAPGGSWSGEARVTPIASGKASLSLAPVRLAGRLGGDVSIGTAVTVSGPLGDGAVDGLSLPIDGRIASSGAVAVAAGCRPLSWRAVRVGTAVLGRNSLDLCVSPRDPLVRSADGSMSGRIVIPGFRLTGSSGASLLDIRASGAGIDISRGLFTLAGSSVRLGPDDDTATRVAATIINGGITGTGFTGSLIGGEGRIAATPFLISEARGDWQFAAGRLTFGGSLDLADAAPDRRFNPLRSYDVALEFAGSRLTATGSLLVEDSGARIAGINLLHDFDLASGRARFAVDRLSFALDGLQPFDISPLVQGLAANVEGRVDGDGEVRWAGDSVTSDGRFTTDSLDFAAAFGPVQGMSGTIRFDDLIALSTPPGQEARFASINPGIEVIDGRLAYQLLPDAQMRVESGRWPFAGGELLLQPTLLDFGADKQRRLTFEVLGVDAALFLQRYQFENVHATGVFDGILPTVFDARGGRVEGGRLISRDGGGSLAYVGELSNRDLGTFGNMAYGALRSLRYDNLTVGLNGAIDGEMLTDVEFSGLAQGEGAVRNIFTRAIAGLPFTFRIRIAAPFRQLLTSARGLYDPSVVVEQNLPALLREQRAAEAARRAGDAGETNVQPTESEDQP